MRLVVDGGSVSIRDFIAETMSRTISEMVNKVRDQGDEKSKTLETDALYRDLVPRMFDLTVDFDYYVERATDSTKQILEYLKIHYHDEFLTQFRDVRVSFRDIRGYLRDKLPEVPDETAKLAKHHFICGLVSEQELDLKHALKCYQAAARFDLTNAAYIKREVGTALLCQNGFAAKQAAVRLNKYCDDTATADPAERAVALSYLGAAEVSLQHYGDAIDYLKAALRIIEPIASQHKRHSLILNNLGYAYARSGSIKEGIFYLESACALRKANGELLKNVAVSANNLADCYRLGEQYERAEAVLLNIESEIRSELAKWGSGQQNTGLRSRAPLVLASTLNNIGALYLFDFEDAERGLPYLEESLSASKILGDFSRNAIGTMWNLAVCYFELARFSESEKFYRRSIALTENAFVNPDPQFDGLKHDFLNRFGSI